MRTIFIYLYRPLDFIRHKLGIIHGVFVIETSHDTHFDKRKVLLNSTLLENNRLEKIKRVIEHQQKHTLPRGEADAHIIASLKYPWYRHQWLRDSAKGIMNMLEAADVLSKYGLYERVGIQNGELESSLGRAINTMWKALYFFEENIKGQEIRDIRDSRSRLGKNHVLARFDVSEDGSVSLCEPDKGQVNELRSWIMQYDSIPLTLLATVRYIKSFGTSDIGYSIDIAKKILPWLATYMINYHNTPCADLWELYYSREKINGIEVGSTIDSYTVASIYAGIEKAKELAQLIKVDPPKDIDSKVVEDFLIKHFIGEIDPSSGKIVCKSKIEYGELMKSVDSSAVEIFRLFKPGRLIGSEVEDNTIKAIEKHLMDNSPLPIRFKFFGAHDHIKDTYFYGGNWYPNAEEYAMYKLGKGDLARVKEIIDFIEGQIEEDGSIPEQSLIKPASQGNDPEHYFEKNGNQMIRCLWWSETGYLGLVSMYIDAVLKKETKDEKSDQK